MNNFLSSGIGIKNRKPHYKYLPEPEPEPITREWFITKIIHVIEDFSGYASNHFLLWISPSMIMKPCINNVHLLEERNLYSKDSKGYTKNRKLNSEKPTHQLSTDPNTSLCILTYNFKHDCHFTSHWHFQIPAQMYGWTYKTVWPLKKTLRVTTKWEQPLLTEEEEEENI